MFEIWPRYVAAKENLENFMPEVSGYASKEEKFKYKKAREIIREGGALLANLATVRVPMPKSTKHFLKKCDDFSSEL